MLAQGAIFTIVPAESPMRKSLRHAAARTWPKSVYMEVMRVHSRGKMLTPVALFATAALVAPVASAAISAPTPATDTQAAAEASSPTPNSRVHTFDLGAHHGDPALGGLSGLAALGEHQFIAISDDKGEFGPTRAYLLTENPEGTFTVSDEIHFRDLQGRALDPGAFDAEEIRVLPNGNLLWSTEGQPDSLSNRAPALIESSPTGVQVRRIQVPEHHRPNLLRTSGIRINQGPEAMAISPNGRHIVTLNENALAQDGPLNDEQRSSASRLTIYDAESGVAVAEYVVSVDPRYPGASDRGYASLDFDDEGNLYALQRGYLPEEGNRGEIIRIELPAELSPAAEQSTAAPAAPAAPAATAAPAAPAATNVLEKQALDGSEVPLGRQVVFDFAEDPAFTPGQGHPDNIEGLQATGSPSNPEGVRFDLVSDNNFSDSQRSVIHTLYVSEPQ